MGTCGLKEYISMHYTCCTVHFNESVGLMTTTGGDCDSHILFLLYISLVMQASPFDPWHNRSQHLTPEKII